MPSNEEPISRQMGEKIRYGQRKSMTKQIFKLRNDAGTIENVELNSSTPTGTGATIYNGATEPSAALGIDGDYYFRTTNGDVYFKAAGAWAVVMNIVGADGAAGADGAQGIQGDKGDAGAQGIQGETGATGANGQDGAAGQQGIQGEQGIQGNAGANGQDGINGNIDAEFYNGVDVPAVGLGTDGDYYLRTNGDVYFKAAGAWSIVTNIKGAQGDQGIQGEQGIQGDQGTQGETGAAGNDGKLFGTIQAATQTLTNVGTAYDNVVISGVWACDWAEVAAATEVRLVLRVNKVGSGTQTWQLWNDTDAASVLEVADSGAAGIKILSSSWTAFTKPTTLKAYRIRAKSTTSGDDPVIYGAMVMFK